MTKSALIPQAGNMSVSDENLYTPVAETPSLPAALSNDLVKTERLDKKTDANPAINNAPLIDKPFMDPDTAMIIVMGVLDNMNKTDIKNTVALLKSDNKFMQASSEEKLKLMIENLEKVRKESAAQKSKQTGEDVGLGFSTAASVFGLIGAIFLAVITLGGGALAVAGAVIGMVMNTLDVGTRIAKAVDAKYEIGGEKKPLDITLGGMVKRIVEEIAHKDDKYPPGSTPENREEKLAQIITGVTIFLSVLVAATTIACSVGSVHLAAKAAKDIAKEGAEAAKTVLNGLTQQQARLYGNAAQLAQVSSEIIEAGSTITSGAYGMQLAFITYDMKDIDLKKTKIDQIMKLLAGEISNNRDFLKGRYEDSGQFFEMVASIVAEYDRSKSKTIVSV